MPLVKSHRLTGYSTTVDYDPRVDVHEDVLFVPYRLHGPAAGVYDRGRRLVTASAGFRGIPHVQPLIEKYVSDVDPDHVRETVDDDGLVFAGLLKPHYGHFLVSSLSRLWWLPPAAASDVRLLILNAEPIEAILALPFVAESLGVLGLTRRNFVQFDRPVRIAKLTIPDASFHENNLAHRAFARSCNMIGSKLTESRPGRPGGGPIYLSKSKISRGVNSIVNEDDLTEQLAKRGVPILHPEAMTLADQIRLFQQHDVVSGFLSSALHTGIFVPKNHMVVLNFGPEVMSNHPMIDAINDNDCLYLYPHREITNQGGNANFGNVFRLHDPLQTALELLRAMDAFASAKNRRPRSAEAESAQDVPAGRLLSRGMPALQSSISAFSVGSTREEDASGAVNGLLTGFYQFCTAEEDRPWWEVDLLSDRSILEVRLYNRMDDAAPRSSRLRILTRPDGSSRWSEPLVRESSDPFGGLDGRPFKWRPWPRLVARHVRVQLLGATFLHLDQVEVFGDDVD